MRNVFGGKIMKSWMVIFRDVSSYTFFRKKWQSESQRFNLNFLPFQANKNEKAIFVKNNLSVSKNSFKNFVCTFTKPPSKLKVFNSRRKTTKINSISH